MTTTEILSPATSAELVDAVRSTPRLVAVGARTKPRLSEISDTVTLLSTRGLSGILEYEPDEFTFTALAGTPVREISEALAAKGQYLPFDPLLLQAGATLGGTVVAGVSGPGRFRYGGVRDFILGVRFVDGAGRLLRMGGKVVKNSAGFDLPKFFVGSLGRFGVLADITFKVFPSPPSRQTLKITTASVDGAVRLMMEAGNSRWETEALELLPDGKTILLRLAGPAEALEVISREVLGRWPGEVLSSGDADATWARLREIQWQHPDGVLIKVAATPKAIPALSEMVRTCDGSRLQVSSGGNVAFVSLPAGNAAKEFHERLVSLNLSGMTLRGDAPLWHGVRASPDIIDGIKHALDAENRFPALDD